MPVTPDEIEGYLAKLDRVSQALEFAQHKYADALAELADLVALLDAYVAKAQAEGVARSADLVESARREPGHEERYDGVARLVAVRFAR